ncbi:hypothetical protein B566_EDAN006150 [Ephemera danica]|nr:hypothetical protein B566_EDAN006150 [Ephemera danica]
MLPLSKLAFTVSTFLCLQVILKSVESAGYTLQCPAPGDISAIRRLKSTLFCDYDLHERPVMNRTHKVTVNVEFVLQSVIVDRNSGNLFLMMWITVFWYDEFLKWPKEDFDNIDEIQVPISQLWVPDLSIYSSSTPHPSLIQAGTERCLLNHYGRIMCIPDVRAPLTCGQNTLRWPYDTRSCVIRIGSWLFHGAQVDIELLYEGYRKEMWIGNPEWEMLTFNVSKNKNVYSCCPDEPYVDITYYLEFKRHSALYITTMIVPAFVFAGITLVSFCTRATTLRAFLSLSSLLGNMCFLLYLVQIIPMEGDSRPNIVVYYRDAMILSALATCVALFVAWIETFHVSMPWADAVTVWLLGKGGRPVGLFLGHTYDDLHQEILPSEPSLNIPAFARLDTALARIGLLR